MPDDATTLDLYDLDFFAWTRAQASALRAQGQSAAVDWARVAEEIEDLGKSDLRECFSRVETLIEHLMKWAWSTRAEPLAGWAETIVRERNALELVLTPTLRRAVEDTLEDRHLRAARAASRAFAAHEPDASRDPSLRWTLLQILGEADDPLPPLA
jgi:hypothetical protein